MEVCPSDHNKYLKIGVTIFITGIIAGLTGGYAIYVSMKGNLVAGIIFGIIWGIAIMNLDSLIVSTIKDTDNVWQKFKVASIRIVISIFIGIVIAHPFELRLFDNEIRQELIGLTLQRCQELAAAQTAEEQKQFDINSTQLGALNAQLAAVTSDLNCVSKLLTNERNGIASNLPCGSSSGKFGLGSRYRDLISREKELSAEKKNLAQRISELNTINKGLQASILTTASGCKKEDIIHDIKNRNISLLEAHETLLIIAEKDDGILTMIVFITLLIILIELSPVIVKLMQSKGRYDELLAEFEEDSRNMNYFDLIQKYPYIPAKKKYLKNFENNKRIYKRLLEEQVAISTLNSKVGNEMQILQDKHDLNRTKTKELNERVANDMKRRQLKIIQEILTKWEEQTLNDIEADPGKYIHSHNGQSSSSPAAAVTQSDKGRQDKKQTENNMPIPDIDAFVLSTDDAKQED